MNLHGRLLRITLKVGITIVGISFTTIWAQSSREHSRSWMNASLSPDERASLVLKEMTLDEKISLLHGTGMEGLGPMSPLAVKSNGGAGYVVGVPRLGIPAIQMSDAAYGVRSSGENGRYSTALPDNLAALIPPHPAGIDRTRESFNNHTGATFDPIGAAETAARHTISLLLNPERAARLVSNHGRDPSQLGLGEVIDQLVVTTWKAVPSSNAHAAIQRAVGDVALNELMLLAANEKAATEVRAMALLKLTELAHWANDTIPTLKDEQERAHRAFAVAQIAKFQRSPTEALKPTELLEMPPGAPIGEE